MKKVPLTSPHYQYIERGFKVNDTQFLQDAIAVKNVSGINPGLNKQKMI